MQTQPFTHSRLKLQRPHDYPPKQRRRKQFKPRVELLGEPTLQPGDRRWTIHPYGATHPEMLSISTI